MKNNDLLKLKKIASKLRLDIFKTAMNAGKGHVPPAFSWVEIATVLFYKNIINFNLKNHKSNNRDKFILSKGHGCLTLYAVFSDLKIINKKELNNFAKNGSLLAGHPDTVINGVDCCSGSLGHGLGVGAGISLANKLKKNKNKTFVLLGDGECQEGSVWEAFAFAPKHKLNNLIAMIDRNSLGSTDFTENSSPLEPLKKKIENFGWNVIFVQGHNIKKIYSTFKKINKFNKPTCIIFNTIKGKGLKLMENSPRWHHQLPKKDLYNKCLEELKNS